MKKLVSILIITVMLIGLVPFAFAAADYSSVPTIAIGETKSVSLSRTSIESYFKFVAAETAEYVFYSTNDDGVDTYGYILTENGEIISENDDDLDLNFGVHANLEQGETYILASRLYNPTLKGDYNVSIIKTGVPATAIVPDSSEFVVFVGDWFLPMVNFEPYASLPEAVTFTSSDKTVVDYAEDGESFEALSAGTATITASTESGLTATISVTVKTPKSLSEETSYTSNLAMSFSDKFTFVPTQTGYYTFNVSATSDVYVWVDEAGSDWGTEVAIDGMFIAGLEYSVEVIADYEDLEYTLDIEKTPAATDFYIEFSTGEIQSTYYSQELYAIGLDGVLAGEFEWSVNDNTIATVASDGDNRAILSFFKEGTVTVTVKCGDITNICTVTGVDPAVITTQASYTEEVVGFDKAVYAIFKPETTGVYKVSVDDTADVPVILDVQSNGSTSNSYMFAHFEADTEYLITASRFQVSYDYDENVKGNVTLSVSKCVEPTGIKLDGGDHITTYVDSYTTLNFAATNDDAYFADDAVWTVEGTEEYELYTYDDGADLYFYEEGEFTVGVEYGEFSDSIKVKVISPDKLDLDTKLEGNTDETKTYHVVEVDVDKPGIYTVKVKSDVPVYVEGYSTASGDNYGTNVKAAISVLSIEKTFVIIYADEPEANFTIELVEPDFPMGVRPLNPEVTLQVGEEYRPDLIFEPSQLTEDIVKITSSNPGVVKINGFLASAVAAGTATIEYTTEYGLKAQVKITVVDDDYEWAYGVSLDEHSIEVDAGASKTLTATVDAEGKKKVVWYSADQSVARVDQNGRVTGISEGVTYICAYVDGNEDWCEVTVKTPQIKESSKTFTDVKDDKWYTNAIDYAYSYGFIAGTSATTFSRDTQVNRGMFITILARIAGVDTGSAANKAATTKFTDVKAGKYYAAAIKWASENGVVSGTGEKTFSPEASISRQDLCVMVTNFAKYMNINLRASTDEVSFTDASSIKKYAKESVKTCQMAGLVKGYNDGSFGPTKTATRAEAAQILYVFHSTFIAK